MRLDRIPDYYVDQQALSADLFKDLVPEHVSALLNDEPLDRDVAYTQLAPLIRHFKAEPKGLDYRSGTQINEDMKSTKKKTRKYLAPYFAWLWVHYPWSACELYDKLDLDYRPYIEGWHPPSAETFLDGSHFDWLSPYAPDHIPLTGRNEQLSILDDFASSTPSYSMMVVSGPAGSGKTRLVAEWLRNSSSIRKWHKSILDKSVERKWHDWVPQTPTVLVIDQMHGFAEDIAHLTRSFGVAGSYGGKHCKLRILVLDRVFPDDLRTLSQDNLWPVAGKGPVVVRNLMADFYSVPNLKLSEANTGDQMLRQIVSTVSGYDSGSEEVVEALNYLENTRGASVPLFAALAGDAIKRKSNFQAMDRRTLTYNYLQSTDRIPWSSTDPKTKVAGLFAATTTMAGRTSFQILFATPIGIDLRREEISYTAGLCKRLTSSSETISLDPIKPDYLGGTYVLELLKSDLNQKDTYTQLHALFQGALIGRILKDPAKETYFFDLLIESMLHDDTPLPEQDESWSALQSFVGAVSSSEELSKPGILQILWHKSLVMNAPRIAEQFGYQGIAQLDLLGAISALSSADFKGPFEGITRAFMTFWNWCLRNPEPTVDAAVADWPTWAKTRRVGKFHTIHVACELGLTPLVFLLIDEGVSIEQPIDELGATPLAVASMYGQTQTVSALLSRGAIAEAPDWIGDYTPLLYACTGGHKDIAVQLLDRGANVESKSSDERATPLRAACFSGNLELVSHLISERNASDHEGSDGTTGLACAARSNSADVVRFLLDRGVDQENCEYSTRALQMAAGFAKLRGAQAALDVLADRFNGILPPALRSDGLPTFDTEDEFELWIERKQFTGQQMLREAARRASSPEDYFRALDRLYGELNDAQRSEWALIWFTGTGRDVVPPETAVSLVYHYASHGLTNLLDIQLRSGDDADFLDLETQWSPLLVAASQGFTETCALLLNHGADVNRADKNGCTAMHLAVEFEHTDLIRLLASRGADCNAPWVDGNYSLLSICAGRNLERSAVALIQCGASIDHRAAQNEPEPLWAAVGNEHLEISQALIDSGADTETRFGEYNGTILIYACESLSKQSVVFLLKNGANPNSVNDRGWSPLHVAFSNEREEIVDLLLRAGASPNILFPDTEMSLLCACIELGHLKSAAALISFDVDLEFAGTGSTATPLWTAWRANSLDGAKLLLEAGVNVDARVDASQMTPLHSMSIEGSSEWINLLLDYGADIHAVTEDLGSFPLSLASHEGHADAVRVLLHRGANVNQQREPYGATSLHLACADNHPEVVKLLLAHGAEVNKRTTDDECATALSYCSEFNTIQCAKILLEHSADPNTQRTNDGSTPLIDVCENGNVEFCELLLSKGADTKFVRHKTGRTALHYAAENGYNGVAKILLDSGAEVNVRDNNRHTPLMAACYSRDLSTVDTLIDGGAQVDLACDDDGWTPLMQAAEGENPAIVHRLLELGANKSAITTDRRTALSVAVDANKSSEIISMLSD